MDDIMNYIYQLYISDNDINDLSKVVSIIDRYIIANIENSSIDIDQKYTIHQSLSDKRIVAKDLLCSKARQGHDFYFKESEPKCKPNEEPRWFYNVSECKTQYNDFVVNVWKPMNIIIRNFENFSNMTNPISNEGIIACTAAAA